jgi:hypothetical protein
MQLRLKIAARSDSARHLGPKEVFTGPVSLSVGAEDSAAAHSAVVRASSVEVAAVDSTVGVDSTAEAVAALAVAMVVEVEAVVMAVVVVLIRGRLELNQPASKSPVFSCLPQLE